MQSLKQRDRQRDFQSLHQTARHRRQKGRRQSDKTRAIYIPFFAEAACPHLHNRTIVGQNLISFRVQLHSENGVTHYSAVASRAPASVRCRGAFSMPFRNFLIYGSLVRLALLLKVVYIQRSLSFWHSSLLAFPSSFSNFIFSLFFFPSTLSSFLFLIFLSLFTTVFVSSSFLVLLPFFFFLIYFFV